ncbi:hypothetical protein SAMN04487779_101521 [Belnapia rosea]|uniref:Uncharacterized protein n=1 Tax=Belnapia rosea TaxID=938405 RepID=A0A1G6YVD9_9PROT|nr:hypothetical protein SAMN04487779_101521 [Belnapia rosea]
MVVLPLTPALAGRIRLNRGRPRVSLLQRLGTTHLTIQPASLGFLVPSFTVPVNKFSNEVVSDFF